LAGAVIASAAEQAAAPQPVPPVLRPVAAAAAPDPASLVRRTTLIVRDLDASIRFYRDVLGFEVWLENRGTVSPSSLPTSAPVGAPRRDFIASNAALLGR
jgi:hypothetical protein